MALRACVCLFEPVLHAYRREPRTAAPVALDGVTGFDGRDRYAGMRGRGQRAIVTA